MVSCRRCGKQGWRYQMEVSDGRWYCERCYMIIEKGEVPSSPEVNADTARFLDQHRVRLEFARYLADKGLLNEGVGEEGTLDEEEYAYSIPAPVVPFWDRPRAA